MVVFRSGAGGARLRLFEAGPAAPNLHLKNVLRVKSDVVSEPEADGARLRLLEPALLSRQICTSAPDFGAQVRLRQGAQTHTTPMGSVAIRLVTSRRFRRVRAL